jgi:hypothetical protein
VFAGRPRVLGIAHVVEVEASIGRGIHVGAGAVLVVHREQVARERLGGHADHVSALAVVSALQRGLEGELLGIARIADVDRVEAALGAGRLVPRVEVREALEDREVGDLAWNDRSERHGRLELADQPDVPARAVQMTFVAAVLMGAAGEQARSIVVGGGGVERSPVLRTGLSGSRRGGGRREEK